MPSLQLRTGMVSGKMVGTWDGRRTEGVHIELGHVDMERKPEIDFLALKQLWMLMARQYNRLGTAKNMIKNRV